jgi:hypothetical protein
VTEADDARAVEPWAGDDAFVVFGGVGGCPLSVGGPRTVRVSTTAPITRFR